MNLHPLKGAPKATKTRTAVGAKAGHKWKVMLQVPFLGPLFFSSSKFPSQRGFKGRLGDLRGPGSAPHDAEIPELGPRENERLG